MGQALPDEVLITIHMGKTSEPRKTRNRTEDRNPTIHIQTGCHLNAEDAEPEKRRVNGDLSCFSANSAFPTA